MEQWISGQDDMAAHRGLQKTSEEGGQNNYPTQTMTANICEILSFNYVNKRTLEGALHSWISGTDGISKLVKPLGQNPWSICCFGVHGLIWHGIPQPWVLEQSEGWVLLILLNSSFSHIQEAEIELLETNRWRITMLGLH